MCIFCGHVYSGRRNKFLAHASKWDFQSDTCYYCWQPKPVQTGIVSA